MTIDAIDFCLKVSQAHASLNLKLDDELGTLHGLSLNDFILLRHLARAEGGRMAVTDLVRPMGVQLSAVTRQLLPLEKTGHVQREPALAGGARSVVLRPAGRRLVGDAMVTADAICAEAVAALAPDALPAVNAALTALCRSEALRV